MSLAKIKKVGLPQLGLLQTQRLQGSIGPTQLTLSTNTPKYTENGY